MTPLFELYDLRPFKSNKGYMFPTYAQKAIPTCISAYTYVTKAGLMKMLNNFSTLILEVARYRLLALGGGKVVDALSHGGIRYGWLIV